MSAAASVPSGQIETIAKTPPELSEKLDAQFAATTTALEAEPTLETLQSLQQQWQASGWDSLVEHITRAAGGQRFGRVRALCAMFSVRRRYPAPSLSGHAGDRRAHRGVSKAAGSNSDFCGRFNRIKSWWNKEAASPNIPLSKVP